MRAAICISGQPRDITIGVEQVLSGIVNANPDVNFDIFCHAWVTKDGESWDTAQPNLANVVGKQEEDPCKIIIAKLQPKLWLFEEQIIFENFVRAFNEHPTAKQTSLASNFYSVFAANNLKKQYEVMEDFVYDVVIRMRYDLWFNEPVILSEYKNLVDNYIIVPRNYQEDQDRISWNQINKGMVDVFAISSSNNMNKYSQTFIHMPAINGAFTPPFGEVYLGVNARIIHELSLHKADINLDLIRRKNVI